MGSFSIWHWLIVLAVIVLLFGGKKLKSFGQDAAEAIKSFRNTLDDKNDNSKDHKDSN